MMKTIMSNKVEDVAIAYINDSEIIEVSLYVKDEIIFTIHYDKKDKMLLSGLSKTSDNKVFIASAISRDNIETVKSSLRALTRNSNNEISFKFIDDVNKVSFLVQFTSNNNIAYSVNIECKEHKVNICSLMNKKQIEEYAKYLFSMMMSI